MFINKGIKTCNWFLPFLSACMSITPKLKLIFVVLVAIGCILLVVSYMRITVSTTGRISQDAVVVSGGNKLPSSARLPSTKFYIRALNSNSVKRGDSFDPHISATELTAMIDLTWAFLDICDHLGISAMMYGGTLLGSYRHHGVMPWDDDVDFLLNERDMARLKMALRHKSSRLSVETTWGRWKVWNRTSCLNKLRSSSYCWPFVDLSFYHRHGDMIYDTVKAFGWNYSYPVNLTFPIIKRPFMGRWLDSPKDALRFIGNDKTPSDQCISLTYSHKFENWPQKPVQQIECSALTQNYPFVVRLPIPQESQPPGIRQTGIVEALRFDGGWYVYSVIVDEPLNAFNVEYSTLPFM